MQITTDNHLNTPNSATRVRLGRTDLEVGRIGIGCGTGLSAADLEYAVSRGINYIFTSTDFHAVTYSRSWDAIRSLCGRNSRRRDEVVLAAASYVCDPEKLIGVLMDQLLALNLDYVDIFQWGWVTRQNDIDLLMDSAHQLLRTPAGCRTLQECGVVVRQVEDELRSAGYARYLAISSHDRSLIRGVLEHRLVDVAMLRYNIAHRGAESEIFPFLNRDRLGTVAFNTTHNWSSLTVPPRTLPAEKYTPTHQDLYRFALDRPEIDVVLTGPATREQIDKSLETLERPPLSERLRAYLCKYGDLAAGRAQIA